MLLRLLTLPVSGPVSGLMWIGDKILEQATPEIDNKENLSQQLLTLQLAFDMGEISEEEFEEKEEELLLAIEAADAEEE